MYSDMRISDREDKSLFLRIISDYLYLRFIHRGQLYRRTTDYNSYNAERRMRNDYIGYVRYYAISTRNLIRLVPNVSLLFTFFALGLTNKRHRHRLGRIVYKYIDNNARRERIVVNDDCIRNRGAGRPNATVQHLCRFIRAGQLVWRLVGPPFCCILVF